ncbi:MAG: hypothetical protein MUC45_06770 [Actinomycetia bacterium]|nr:hypothetical protein [Actinomycetes bacterium]
MLPRSPRLAAAGMALVLSTSCLAVPALAAPLQRILNTVDDFSCAFLTEEGPAVYVFGQASSSGSGSGAFVEGEDLYVEGWEGSAEFGEGSLAASVDLVTMEGEPYGTVRVEAVTTLGPATVLPVEERTGNTWTRGTITVADFTFTDVVITVDGLTPVLDETTCSGQRTAFDVRSNDPASRVYRDAGSLASDPCVLEGMDDAELRLSGRPRAPYLEVVLGGQGDDPRKAEGVLERSGARWVASLPLVSLVSGEQVDVLDVTTTLSRAGTPTRQREASGGFAEMAWVVPYVAEFRIRTSEDLWLTAECPVAEVRTHTTIAPQLVRA